MFTGIIEQTGSLAGLSNNGSNIIFQIKAPELAQKLGESIAINGACLTVIKFDQEYFWVENLKESGSIYPLIIKNSSPKKAQFVSTE